MVPDLLTTVPDTGIRGQFLRGKGFLPVPTYSISISSCSPFNTRQGRERTWCLIDRARSRGDSGNATVAPLKHEASRKEIVEALGVAITVNAGAALVHSARAINAYAAKKP